MCFWCRVPRPVSAAVLLTGDGLLHGVVGGQLGQQGLRVGCVDADDLDAAPESAVVLAVTDGCAPDLHARVNRVGLRRRIPSLRVFIEPGRAVVGPCVVPGEPGCATCAETRRSLAREHADEHTELTRRFAGRLAVPSQSWLTLVSSTILAEIVTAEVESALDGTGRPMTLRALYFLRLDDLHGGACSFLPDPLCVDCATVPKDSPAAATIVVQPRPKCSPASNRVRRLADRADELRRTFVDAETGLVRGVARDGHSVFPNASAKIGLRDRHGTEIGFGRTLNYADSELTAITESLERYGGIRPGGRRTVVRGSYRDLTADALHPAALGLHAGWQYELRNFRFQRYQDDLVVNWVWGYSFRRQAPILVPESYAYYGHSHRGDRPFVYEISNGCALGGCLEEAVLHGLLEVAERDAFLMTWYARMRRSRVDPDSARDRSVPLMVDRIEDTSGYRVHAIDITTEHGIPALWVMAVDEHGGDRPKAHIAAGSHLDPERALANALLELAPLVNRPVEAYLGSRRRALAMLDDPYEVRNMDDHAVLYSTPEAFERLSFLYDTDQTVTFEDAFGKSDLSAWQPDLTVDLGRAIRRYLDTGLDVIVVDQTTPEHEAGDFRCVKVIVPGTLPITFGYHHQRTTGFERLSRVPWELGYAQRPLDPADLNPHPHPFP